LSQPRGIPALGAVLSLHLALAAVADAQVELTQQEALELTFPPPLVIERRTAFLGEGELERARQLAGGDVEVDQSVVTYYLAMDGDSPVGVAYFDAHRVRTLPEVLMLVVTPEAKIERIEVLKFSEPPEYRVPESWIQQLYGKKLTDDLSVKGSIVNMTGATLTSHAVTHASRRVLALNQVIRPFDELRK
jgi:hypothetical protein